ncbi:hypothetical protein ERJ75_000956700 [Trypanosoma vivax]|nr:hypothetical protein ERJ75_000956700 [Trypanosoma vivax]
MSHPLAFNGTLGAVDVPPCIQEKLKDLRARAADGRTKHLSAYTIDAPITEADVERWRIRLSQSAPPPSAPNATFLGGGFLNAATVLAMSNDADRRRAIHKLAPMQPFDPCKAFRLPMSKVLMHRRKWLPYRQRFPIYQCRGPILDALLNNYVVALIAPQGSGRTNQLPQVISETEAFKSQRVIVVCPTVLAAQRTVTRLREERCEEPSTTTVGLCIPMQYDVVQGTHIAVTTADMLVRQLLCDPLLLRVGCVIFDDIHIRTPLVELCMSFIRSTLRLLKEECAIEKRGGALRLVVNCADDSTAASITEYFGSDYAVRVNLQQILQRDLKIYPDGTQNSVSAFVTPCMLYLEETMQWLTKCEEEGSFICRDPAEELVHYVENIGVVAKVMAAVDADFSNDDKLRSHWCPIIVNAVHHYCLADGKETVEMGREGQPEKAAIVVIAPNAHSVAVIAESLRRYSDGTSAVEEQNDKKQQSGFSSLNICVLPESMMDEEACLPDLCGEKMKDNSGRLVIVTTPLMAQTGLPSTLTVSFVVDCARRSYSCFDVDTGGEVSAMSYSYVQELSRRQTVARLPHTVVDSSCAKSGSSFTSSCMVLQLIPKLVLYSAHHRRYSADHTHHAVFHMRWDEYLQLYHFLQAYEEGLRCCESTGTSGSEANNPLSTRVSQLFSSHFIGVPPSSSSRYEQLRRIFVALEEQLGRLGHLVQAGDAGSPARLSPLGVAAVCLPWSVPVVRLLLFSRLCECLIPATVIAASWTLGDFFSSYGNKPSAEARELIQEARAFFSRDTGSDMVGTYHAYRMWLTLRDGSEEGEEAFLSESQISREVLMKFEQRQLSFLRILKATGIISSLSMLMGINRGDDEQDATGTLSAALSSAVLDIPENALLEGHILLQCITAAIYPQCAIPHDDGTVSSLNSVESAVRNATSNAAGLGGRTQRPIPLPAIYSRQSVMSVQAVYGQFTDKLFLYFDCDRLPDGGVLLLQGASPLCMDAAVVACGELCESPKPSTHRCRGWTSVLTTRWRQTSSARRLPPPAQLPPVSIPLALYDTIRVHSVIMCVDGMFSVHLRCTAASWLKLLREQTRCRLQALVGDKLWPSENEAAVGLQEAWEWWSRRVREAQSWLREERGTLKEENTIRTAVQADENCENVLLWPFYQYTANPGRPPSVVPPKRGQGMKADADSQILDAAAASASAQPTAYTGRLPDPVMDANIQHSARSIAKARSREQEAIFLKTYPDLFAFLDPEHEFHGYYLHVLRREAPDLEVLGDNLEELEKFLQELETDVQREVGIYCEGGVYGGTNGDSQQEGASAVPGRGSDAPYQFQEVNAEEYMVSYGMQVESSAEHVTRPRSLFKAHDASSIGSRSLDNNRSVPQASSFFSQANVADAPPSGILGEAGEEGSQQDAPPPTNSTVLTDNFTFDKDQGNQSTAPPVMGVEASAVSGPSSGDDNNAGHGTTLLEQLLAMKGANIVQQPQNTDVEFGSTPKDSSALPVLPELSVPAIPNASVPVWPGGALGLQQPPPFAQGPGFSVPASSGVGSNMSALMKSQIVKDLLEVMGVPTASPPVNPLTIPPPPLPAEAFANCPPSVLVYPLPPREFGNIPLIIAKALGETMGVKVGPTRIVGTVGRVEVPNHKVEARALELKSFTCVGRKVHIFKNDRIVDGIQKPSVGRLVKSNANVRGGILQHVSGEEAGGEKFRGKEGGGGVLHANGGGYLGARHAVDAMVRDPRTKSRKLSNVAQIGLLTDSEDDGDSSSNSASD